MKYFKFTPESHESELDASAMLTIKPEDQNSGKTYKMFEIERHNKVDDAWTVVDGIVYNVSRLLKVHPGGFSNLF